MTIFEAALKDEINMINVHLYRNLASCSCPYRLSDKIWITTYCFQDNLRRIYSVCRLTVGEDWIPISLVDLLVYLVVTEETVPFRWTQSDVTVKRGWNDNKHYTEKGEQHRRVTCLLSTHVFSFSFPCWGGSCIKVYTAERFSCKMTRIQWFFLCM